MDIVQIDRFINTEAVALHRPLFLMQRLRRGGQVLIPPASASATVFVAILIPYVVALKCFEQH